MRMKNINDSWASTGTEITVEDIRNVRRVSRSEIRSAPEDSYIKEVTVDGRVFRFITSESASVSFLGGAVANGEDFDSKSLAAGRLINETAL